MTKNNERFVKIVEHIARLNNIDKKSLEQIALKTSEETGELAQAVLSYCKASGTEYKGLTEQNVIDESADVVICAISLVLHVYKQIHEEKALDKFLDAIEDKMSKWESKIS